MTIGQAIDDMYQVREQKRTLDKQIKDINKILTEKEQAVAALLENAGITSAKGTHATASITNTIVPSVDDWDMFYDHIQTTGDFHLLERRPAVRAFRELFDSGMAVPGLKPFTKQSLSLRNL